MKERQRVALLESRHSLVKYRESMELIARKLRESSPEHYMSDRIHSAIAAISCVIEEISVELLERKVSEKRT